MVRPTNGRRQNGRGLLFDEQLCEEIRQLIAFVEGEDPRDIVIWMHDDDDAVSIDSASLEDVSPWRSNRHLWRWGFCREGGVHLFIVNDLERPDTGLEEFGNLVEVHVSVGLLVNNLDVEQGIDIAPAARPR